MTDLRLQQWSATQARTANWLTTLQTSLLGALLGTFGVAQAFGGFEEVSASFRVAVVLVATLALMLPLLAARWTNGYRWPELTAATIVGSTGGWAAAAAISSGMPIPIVLAAAAFGAALCASAASLANSRRRQPPPSPTRAR